MSIEIIALINGKNVGDDNNARGTAIALASAKQVSFKELHIDNIQEVLNSTNNQIILVAAGAHMIKPLSEFKEGLPNGYDHKFIISWASHQLPDSTSLDTIKNAADVIALPVHALKEEDKAQFGDKLVTTIGVAHNRTPKSVEANAKKISDAYNLPEDNDHGYIIVSLAGDAPDANGKIKFYTSDEAKKLGILISKYAADHNMPVLATNGPRTGKYDTESGTENKQYHIQGAELDNVSKAFVSAFERTDKLTFINFEFGPQFKNPYDLFLYKALTSSNSIAFVGGESTSQVSEMSDILGSENVIVYLTGSMNEVHNAHVASVDDKTNAQIIDPRTLEELKILSDVSGDSDLIHSAAELISDKIESILWFTE